MMLIFTVDDHYVPFGLVDLCKHDVNQIIGVVILNVPHFLLENVPDAVHMIGFVVFVVKMLRCHICCSKNVPQPHISCQKCSAAGAVWGSVPHTGPRATASGTSPGPQLFN